MSAAILLTFDLPPALSVLVCRPLSADDAVVHGHGLARRKAVDAPRADVPADAPAIEEAPALAATLVQTHTDERVLLDATGPSSSRFDALLADRITGSSRAIDPRLLDLLRSVVASFHVDRSREAPRIEIVSGFRSPKLNEMFRKKGHHVASHSQHSLGHAVEFRIVLPENAAIEKLTDRGVDPRDIEKRIRALGWPGGTGIYLSKDDWFIHADVGPNRRWQGQ
jgi:uncharacterized protein YcbK (DUF882 family)